MADHGARDHATWAASSTARNWHCPGALAMTAGAAVQPESIHAARGTAAHQVSEKCLRNGEEPVSYLGKTESTKEHDIVVDDEIVSSATEYVEYVNSRCDEGGTLSIEQRFSLKALGSPFDAGGTADAVFAFAEKPELEVIDLKHGVGVVDVTGNPQLRTYALGALLANPGIRVDRITVTIVQPRAPIRGQTIRSETFHVAELVDWTAELLAAMARSKQALDEYNSYAAAYTGVGNADWQNTWLRPGKCRYCAAEATCPANRKERLETVDARIVEKHFQDVTPIRNSVDVSEAELLARDLDGLDALEDWIKARRAHAHALAERGTDVPGWRLVDSYGHRKWAVAEAEVVERVSEIGGLPLDGLDVYDRKLKTPAAVDKLLGKAKAADPAFKALWEKPKTGRTLVRAESDRPSAPGIADRHFEARDA